MCSIGGAERTSIAIAILMEKTLADIGGLDLVCGCSTGRGFPSLAKSEFFNDRAFCCERSLLACPIASTRHIWNNRFLIIKAF